MVKTRVLVADDQKDAAAALAAMLRQLGCDVCTVHDGRQAIVAAPTFQPDVAILDINMPELDGYDTQVALRKQDRSTSTFYVACTASCDEEVSVLLWKLGFDYHLRKPTSLDQLISLLAEVPERRRREYRSVPISQSSARPA